MIRPNGSTTGTSKLGALTITGAGGLDLTNNNLIVEDATNHTSTLATLHNQDFFGWTHSAGIFSSTLPPTQAIAVIDNALAGLGTFGGVAVDSNSILVGPELLGDLNLDGRVDAVDLDLVTSHLGQSTLAWTDGNFDGQPTIDAFDVQVVQNNLGLSLPEPTGLMMLWIGGSALMSRIPAHRASARNPQIGSPRRFEAMFTRVVHPPSLGHNDPNLLRATLVSQNNWY